MAGFADACMEPSVRATCTRGTRGTRGTLCKNSQDFAAQPSLVALRHFCQHLGSAFTQSRCAATLDANTRHTRKERRFDDSILILNTHLTIDTSKNAEESGEDGMDMVS